MSKCNCPKGAINYRCPTHGHHPEAVSICPSDVPAKPRTAPTSLRAKLAELQKLRDAARKDGNKFYVMKNPYLNNPTVVAHDIGPVGRYLASIHALHDLLADYDKALVEAERDAARYRWLRHGDNDEAVMRVYDQSAVDNNRAFDPRIDAAWLPRMAALDAAIDAAIKESASESIQDLDELRELRMVKASDD